jgi:hypothetical protein
MMRETIERGKRDHLNDYQEGRFWFEPRSNHVRTTFEPRSNQFRYMSVVVLPRW